MFGRSRNTTGKPPANEPDVAASKQGSHRAEAEIELTRRDIMLACLENMSSQCKPTTNDGSDIEESFDSNNPSERLPRDIASGAAGKGSAIGDNGAERSLDIKGEADGSAQDWEGSINSNPASGGSSQDSEVSLSINDAAAGSAHDSKGSLGIDAASGESSQDWEGSNNIDGGSGESSEDSRSSRVEGYVSTDAAPTGELPDFDDSLEELLHRSGYKGQEVRADVVPDNGSGYCQDAAPPVETAPQQHSLSSARAALANGDHPMTGPVSPIRDSCSREQANPLDEADETGESLSLAEQIAAAARAERERQGDSVAERKRYESVAGPRGSKNDRVANDGARDVATELSGKGDTNTKQRIDELSDSDSYGMTNHAEPPRVSSARSRGLRRSRPRKIVACASLVDEIMTSIVLADIAEHNGPAVAGSINEITSGRNVKLPSELTMRCGENDVPSQTAGARQRSL